MDTDLSSVREHIRAGRFDAARALLATLSGPSACLERAKLALRDGDHEAAGNAIEALALASCSKEDRLFAMAIGSCIGRPSPALVTLRDAHEHIDEIIYYIALGHYYRGDAASARTWLQGHVPITKTFRAWYLLLSGYISALDNNFELQIHQTFEAMDALVDEKEEVYLFALLGQSAAHILAELPISNGARRLAELERGLEWTDELSSHRFQIVRALGWNAIGRNDAPTALKLFARAASIAKKPIHRAYAHLDRSEAAKALGEMHSAEAEIALAIEAIESFDLKHGTDEGIVLLAVAGRVIADSDPQRAQHYAELALKLRATVNPLRALAHGPRLRAIIGEALAHAQARSDRASAIKEGRDAYDTFAAIGYEWRAGRLALQLHKLTGYDVWRKRALSHASHYPALRVKIANTKTLTPRQKELVDLLDRGFTLQEIADRVGSSRNSVKTMLRRLFNRTGARSQRALIEHVKAS